MRSNPHITMNGSMSTTNHQLTNRDVHRLQVGRAELIERITVALGDNESAEPLDGLHLFRVSTPAELGHGVTTPSLCVIAQGRKEVVLGDRCYRYDPAHYLISTEALPVAGRITEASPEHPYLGLVLTLEPSLVSSVLVEATGATPQRPS